MLVFDLESNGLLDTMDTIHCLVTHDTDTGITSEFNCHDLNNLDEGIALVENHPEIAGHNIQGFDIPAIQILYPNFKPKGRIFDTLIISRLIWTNLRETDFANWRKDKEKFPGQHIGRHGLAAWGLRLGNHKDDYKGGWEKWSPEMQRYCVQDVMVNVSLVELILSKEYSREAIDLEQDVDRILRRQEAHGFSFDEKSAASLYATMIKRKTEVEQTLREVFPDWYVSLGRFTPKRPNKKSGYEKDVPLTKVALTTFNPGSRDHIADRLIKKYGWQPKAFGADGKPTVDEQVLSGLSYPEVPLLQEYLMLNKRIGQISEGKQAWLKLSVNGAIHGRVNTNGAVTGRMTHSNPNVAQVPAVRSLFGKECRSLFKARPGFVLVGCDASGLELRCLAHYMGDDAYTETVLNGDIHSANQEAAGLPTRDNAKTFIYAFLYGAGDAKIGSIVGQGPKAGKILKTRFLKRTPALGRLVKGVQTASKRGYLKGLDGRHLHVRSPHAALNTLLQGAGAIAMKKALVILDDLLQEAGFIPGTHYEFVANVHDEWQIECRPDIADQVGSTAVRAIQLAGEHFNFRCPLDGEYSVGKTWADTH